MMKRIICTAFAFILIFSLTSCGEKNQPSGGSIVGTWKYSLNEKYRDVITEVIVDEKVYTDIYYIFNEDGTGRTYASDGSYDREFTYVYENGTVTITSDGYTFDQKCILTVDTLTIHDDSQGDDIVFKKQQ